jgi:AraC-like DNA-binding protein
LQQAIDYIHTHLDQDLSLVELAGVINISPTYFASLFKRAMGDFTASVCDSTASRTGKINAVENGFGDRRHCLTTGFL